MRNPQGNVAKKTAKAIFAGEWPEGTMTAKAELRVINFAGEWLENHGAIKDPELHMDKINNFALWLGGLHRDVQVYAWQLIRRYHGIEVYADDKTSVRLQPLEEKIFQGQAYHTKHVEKITKHHWPRVWADGSTFEERVDALVDEIEDATDNSAVTADRILSGLCRGPVDMVDLAWCLIDDCLVILRGMPGSKSNQIADPLYCERLNHYIEWLTEQSPEIAIMGMRMALMKLVPVVNGDKLPAFEVFVKTYGELITQVPKKSKK